MSWLIKFICGNKRDSRSRWILRSIRQHDMCWKSWKWLNTFVFIRKTDKKEGNDLTSKQKLIELEIDLCVHSYFLTKHQS